MSLLIAAKGARGFPGRIDSAGEAYFYWEKSDWKKSDWQKNYWGKKRLGEKTKKPCMIQENIVIY